MMALVADTPRERKTSSTLLDIQLRRRERRSRNFLLNLSTNEVEAIPSPEEVAKSPLGDAPDTLPQVVKTPEELSTELEEWVKSLTTFETFLSCNDLRARFLIPSSVAKDAESLEPYPDLEKFKYTYKGGRDKEKRFHGLGEIEFENGCYMSGEWQNGKRQGKFRMDTESGAVTYLEGFYVNNKLQGRVRVQFNTGKWVIGYTKDSVLHGFCKFYDSEKKLELVGMARNGKPFGTCWKLLTGGGYIVGRVDSESEFTGNNIAFIFPDRRTCFQGVFENCAMKKTQAVTIKGFETEYNCVKVPVFNVTESDKLYKTEISTTEWLTENPLLEDPYESRTVYVRQSNTPGADDGLFAARDLKQNSIAAFYNGIRRLKPADSATTWQEQDNAYKIFDPSNKSGVVDILPKFQSMSAYRASLAHKTNHSFLPNCEFGEAFHPRWGLVPCLMTRQDVSSGEELLVTYGYDLDYCPDWYKDAWENSCMSFDSESSLKSG